MASSSWSHLILDCRPWILVFGKSLEVDRPCTFHRRHCDSLISDFVVLRIHHLSDDYPNADVALVLFGLPYFYSVHDCFPDDTGHLQGSAGNNILLRLSSIAIALGEKQNAIYLTLFDHSDRPGEEAEVAGSIHGRRWHRRLLSNDHPAGVEVDRRIVLDHHSLSDRRNPFDLGIGHHTLPLAYRSQSLARCVVERDEMEGDDDGEEVEALVAVLLRDSASRRVVVDSRRLFLRIPEAAGRMHWNVAKTRVIHAVDYSFVFVLLLSPLYDSFLRRLHSYVVVAALAVPPCLSHWFVAAAPKYRTTVLQLTPCPL